MTKAIILSGGTGSRLYPSTIGTSKQLMPVFDKPMIYYSIATLLAAGVRDFLIITNPHNVPAYEKVLQDGRQWGVSIRIVPQEKPAGLPFAFTIAEECGFISHEPCVMMLGDNILHGRDAPMMIGSYLREICRHLKYRATDTPQWAYAFSTRVKDSHLYGNVTFTEDGAPLHLVEKPEGSQYGWVVIGLYIVDRRAAQIARDLKPAKREETEIVDLLGYYMAEGSLTVEKLGDGYAWFDCGSAEALLEASQYVHAVQSRQGNQIGCPEEVALRAGLITADKALSCVAHMPTSYGDYVRRIVEGTE
jgi:glucose-1-phosphate thymidylyltransferase